MINSRRIHRVGLILLTVLIGITLGQSVIITPIQAQDEEAPTDVIINYPELIEGGGSQQLNLYFNLINQQRQPVNISVGDIETANIAIGANSYSAEIVTPDTPFYVVVVLDVSGSMRNALDTMKQAAAQAIANLPDRALVSVMTFNVTENITRLVDFTNDRNSAINEIARIQINEALGTCLYDATYQAVAALRDKGLAPSERRAVIVFTDGRDELIAGGQFDQCSEHNFDEALELAQDPIFPVPLHTIGLRGNADVSESELRTFAEATGGFSAIGGQAELSDLFNRIARGLVSQRIARATICEQQGALTALLTLRLGRGENVSETADLTAETTCEPPTPTPTLEPLAIGFDSVIFNEASETLTLRIIRQGTDPVDRFRVRIRYKDLGIQIPGEYGDFNVPGDTTAFTIETANLRGDEPLEIIVTALDTTGNLIGTAGITEAVLARATPTPIPTDPPTATPETITFAVDSFVFDPNTETLRFNLQHTGSNVVQYRVQIIYQNTGLQFPGEFGDFRVEAGTQQVEISTVGILSGEPLVFNITPIDINGSAMAAPTQIDRDIQLDRPTPTPSPTETPTLTPSITPSPVITNTPVPITITIDSFQFDEATERLTIIPTRTGEGTVSFYRIQIFYRDRATLAQAYSVPADQEIITLDTAGIRGNEALSIRITAQDQNEIAISAPFEQIVEAGLGRSTPTPTPTSTETATATATATLTPSPTPIVVAIDLIGISPSQDGRSLILGTRLQAGADTVTGYQVRVIKKPENQIVMQPEFNGAPSTQVTVPVPNLETGEYEILIEIVTDDPSVRASASQVVRYNQPPPPPLDFAGWLRQNGVLLIGIVLVLLLFAVLLLMTVRRRADIQPDFRPITRPPIIDDAGNVTLVPDVESIPVLAELMIVETTDGRAGEQIKIDRTPFRLGREGGRSEHKTDYDFADQQISRAHAAILYENGQFSIQDAGSRTGTFVNGEKLNAPYVIRPGEEIIIGLGRRTQLKFVFIDLPAEPIPPSDATDKVPIYNPSETEVDLPVAKLPLRPKDEDTIVEMLVMPVNTLRLVKANDEAQDTLWNIMAERFTVGSGIDNDAQIEARSVSRHHAVLIYENMRFFIEDLDSKNGTFLNGEKIIGRRQLEPQEVNRITLGSRTELEFQYRVPMVTNTNDEDTEIE